MTKSHFFLPKCYVVQVAEGYMLLIWWGGGPNKSKFFIVFPGFNRGEGCVTRVVPLSQAPMIHIYPRQTFDNAESISRKTGLSSALV